MAAFADDVCDRPALAGHRFHVEVQFAVGRSNHFGEPDPRFGVEHKIALGRAERFQRDRDTKLSAGRHRGVQHFGCVRFGIVVGNARQQIALLGRAEYHDVPAQVGADFGERSQVIGSPTPHRGFGTGEIKAVGLRQ